MVNSILHHPKSTLYNCVSAVSALSLRSAFHFIKSNSKVNWRAQNVDVAVVIVHFLVNNSEAIFNEKPQSNPNNIIQNGQNIVCEHQWNVYIYTFETRTKIAKHDYYSKTIKCSLSKLLTAMWDC